MTSDQYFNVRALGSIVMGVIILIGTIVLVVLDRLGRIQLDDDPKQKVVGVIVLALFGILQIAGGWLSVRKPKPAYKVTNKPSVIRR
jgi:hypothetical protein